MGEKIFPFELTDMSPRSVKTREEMLNTVDRLSVEAGAKDARAMKRIMGDKSTGNRILDGFITAADSVVTALPQRKSVKALEQVDLKTALMADRTVRAPLERAKLEKRVNRYLEKMGEPPLTQEEQERFNKKTREGFTAEYNGLVNYLSKDQPERNNPNKKKSNQELPEAPRSKPQTVVPRPKPAVKSDLESSDVGGILNPFNLRSPDLRQQARILELNPVRARQLIKAAGRDPGLFGL
ncbi:hypothetical protein IWQ49_006635 [Labrenzia sp. EL_126]|nr:hypothetical protein [Labrenzia sp. EL_126]